MRTFLKIVLLLSLFSVASFANLPKIDECKSDLYYANGILIQKSKFEAEKIWEEKALALLSNTPEFSKNIQEYKVAYNHSDGVVSDLFESFIQKTEAEPELKVTWEAFKLFVGLKLKKADDLLGLAESVNSSIESYDLTEQVKAYKDSIKNGHGVIVISHSQGNLFTNRAYARLDDWMKPYFNNMGVATPAHEVASGGPYVTFDNDPIHYIPNSLEDNLVNENRYYSHINALGERVEALTGAFHSFDYYLGSPILINNIYVSTNKAREQIQAFIIEKIQEHSDADSQWVLDNELNKGTKDYKITLKHRFDTTITSMQDIEVYPFNPSEKLYHVIDNTGGNGWVKASCGGEEVFDKWDGQESNEAYLINNPKKEILEYKCEKIDGVLAMYNPTSGLCEALPIPADSYAQKGSSSVSVHNRRGWSNAMSWGVTLKAYGIYSYAGVDYKFHPSFVDSNPYYPDRLAYWEELNALEFPIYSQPELDKQLLALEVGSTNKQYYGTYNGVDVYRTVHTNGVVTLQEEHFTWASAEITTSYDRFVRITFSF